MRIYCGFLVFCILSLSVVFPANAQIAPNPEKLDIITLRPSPGKAPFLFSPQLLMPAHLEFGVSLVSHAGMNPFVIYNMSGDTLDTERAKAVSLLALGELGGFIGLFDKYMVGLSIPVGYIQGNKITDEGLEGDAIPVLAWGDLSLYLRGLFHSVDKLHLGGELKINAPTGQFSKNYTGELYPTVEPRFLTTWHDGDLIATAMLGMLVRFKTGESAFFNDDFKPGPQFTYGLGVAYRVLKDLHVTSELVGRSGFSSAIHDHPMEAGIGVNFHMVQGLHLQAGANFGLLAGLGTPMVRGIVGLRYAPASKDSDGDGIPDEYDRCPNEPGDPRYQGCPIPDRDADGVPDDKDLCPDEPGTPEFHGCPNPDPDGDGLCDSWVSKQKLEEKFAKICTGIDQCPNHAGPKETRGCPANMLDSDDDGIPDDQDKCPHHPGPPESHGCPPEMADSDGDGVLDVDDKCPNDVGPKETHGCPPHMWDSDGDGVMDDWDKCPGQMETINGVKDFDGCPDEGKPWWELTTIKIMGDEQVQIKITFPSSKHEWFTQNGHGDQLTDEGQRALGQVVLVMLTRKEALKRVIVMVHTDATAKDPEALTTRQGEVMKEWMVKHRLPADRIAVAPMGFDMPEDRGRSARHHKRNRRVWFIVPVE